MILLILLLSPFAFSTGIHFTSEQCQRFKTEGITGSDYYINEALYRDCGISQNSDLSGGEFSDLVLNVDTSINNKQNCDLKNQALNNSNSGYLQDVVTFNDMHPDYFYPDRADEYPFVFAIQVPSIKGGFEASSGVSVDIDSVEGCREKVENLLGEKLKNNNVIMTAGHTFIREKNNECYPINSKDQKSSAVARGKDVSKYDFASPIDKVICVTKNCSDINKDVYNDFCVLVTNKQTKKSVRYSSFSESSNNKLVSYQTSLINYYKPKDIKSTERIISKTSSVNSQKFNYYSPSEPVLTHQADSARGSSGGGLFNKQGNFFALQIRGGQSLEGPKFQKGVPGTWKVNVAIDPQKACQRLSTVLN